MPSSEIERRTKEVIGVHPEWGKRKVAEAVRAEFGKAPRWETILKYKAEVAYREPQRAGEFYRTGGVSPSKRDIYMQWRKDGFTPFEARELTQGHGVKVDSLLVLTSKPGMAARKARRGWVHDRRNEGWTWKEIRDALKAQYIRDRKLTPWDFIRAEYKPRQKVDFIAYREMQRKQSEKNIAGLYHRRRR